MQRKIIEKLKDWRDSKGRKPLILKGARQIGKTYILEDFGQKCFKQYHYINFEKDKNIYKLFEQDLDPRRIIQDISLKQKVKIDIKNDLIIFDEIQQCPEAITSLKYFNEDLPELAIVAAGSLLGVKLNQTSYPVGKVEHLNMFPMSFEEFLLGTGEEQLCELLENLKLGDSISSVAHELLWEQLKKYMVVGGLPEVVKVYREHKDDLFTAFSKVREAQLKLIETYNSDIAKHCGKENAMHIERIFKNIPYQLSQEHEGSANKYKFKGVLGGVNNYLRLSGPIDWLLANNLIIKVPIIQSIEFPLLANTKENRFKLYIFDIGILGALGDLDPQIIWDYDFKTYKGYFAENFIAQEFICKDARTNRLFSWRSGNQAEVEFVREIDKQVIPIEVKSGWATRTKSLKVYAERYKPAYRVIMSANNLNIDETNKVHRYPLYLAGKFPLTKP